MKQNRLLHMMGEIEEGYIEEAGVNIGNIREAKCGKGNHRVTFPWQKWCAVAASLAVIAGLGIAMVQSGLFGGRNHEVILENGDKITFVKAEDFIMADQKINATARDLNKEEAEHLFPGLSVVGDALFDTENGNFMGIEGDIGEMDLFVAKKGIMIDDTIVVGVEEVSTVNGLDVTAGYFLTSPNSKGERRIIYYANFEIGDTVFGLEHAGPEADAETLRQELVAVIQKLIEKGEPDFGFLEE